MPAPVPCEHSQPFFNNQVALGTAERVAWDLMVVNRPLWDRYYDHVAGLPAGLQAEAAPEACAAVTRILQASNDIVEQRRRVVASFHDAIDGKAKALTTEAASRDLQAGEAYLLVFEGLRTWRIAHLDGRDVDMCHLLDERTDLKDYPRTMFGRAFCTFARTLNPRRPIMDTRAAVLDGLAQLKPELARLHIARRDGGVRCRSEWRWNTGPGPF